MKRKWTVIGMVAVLLASVLTGCGEKKAGEYFQYEIMGEKENRYIRIMELTELGERAGVYHYPGRDRWHQGDPIGRSIFLRCLG